MLLIYQLWFKQIWLNNDNNILSSSISNLISHADNQFKNLNLELPVRTSLTNLSLVSTQLEPHPNRDSVILLRLNVVNNATISQPFSLVRTISDEY